MNDFLRTTQSLFFPASLLRASAPFALPRLRRAMPRCTTFAGCRHEFGALR